MEQNFILMFGHISNILPLDAERTQEGVLEALQTKKLMDVYSFSISSNFIVENCQV